MNKFAIIVTVVTTLMTGPTKAEITSTLKIVMSEYRAGSDSAKSFILGIVMGVTHVLSINEEYCGPNDNRSWNRIAAPIIEKAYKLDSPELLNTDAGWVLVTLAMKEYACKK